MMNPDGCFNYANNFRLDFEMWVTKVIFINGVVQIDRVADMIDPEEAGHVKQC